MQARTSVLRHAIAVTGAAIGLALALAPAALRAQQPMGEEDPEPRGNYAAHQPHDLQHDCTFCRPWLYVEGAALLRPVEGDADDETDVAVRAKLEIGTPSPHLGLFTHLQIVPDDGPSPSLRYGLQLWTLPRFSDFNLTGGIGLVHDADVVRGWGHVALEYQTPLHEIALYAQAGTRFAGDDPEEFQIGIRHPIAPWKFHGIP